MEFSERSLPVLHLMEPFLEFGSAQTAAHPKDGLFLYGPHNKPKKTKDVRIGVVGTVEGIRYFRAWATEIKKGVKVPPPGKTEKKDRLLSWPWLTGQVGGEVKLFPGWFMPPF